ncbi:hypothetical protein VTO73DRAFT_9197 [Trametes versicolor]
MAPSNHAGVHLACTASPTPHHGCEETAQRDVDPAQCILPEKVSQLQITPDRVISPSTLPPELLQLIFEHTIDTVDTGPEANARLVEITHVCRYWRDVALHTPTLWTHIAVSNLDAVKTFLKRSQDLPLYSFIHTTPEALANPKHVFNQVFQAYLTQYGRTYHFKASVTQSHAFDFVMRRIASTRAPLLEKVDIERLPPRETFNIPASRPAEFDGVPRLRYLKLFGEFLPWLPKGPNALTEINLDSALHDVYTLVSLLGRSPFLERVTISGWFNPRGTRDARRVTLTRIKSLRVESYPIRGIAALLPSLILPSQHTEIAVGTRDRPWPYSWRGDNDSFSDLVPAREWADPLRWAALEGLRRVELSSSYGANILRAYRTSEVDDGAAAPLQVSTYHWSTTDERFFVRWPFDASLVETVTIDGWFTIRGRERWSEMFAAVPVLQTLRVKGINTEMLDGLILGLAPDRLDPVCTQLQTLVLQDITLEKPAWKALMDVVASRSPGAGGCLSHVELSLKGPAVWGQSTSRRIREAGVELVLSASV